MIPAIVPTTRGHCWMKGCDVVMQRDVRSTLSTGSLRPEVGYYVLFGVHINSWSPHGI